MFRSAAPATGVALAALVAALALGGGLDAATAAPGADPASAEPAPELTEAVVAGGRHLRLTTDNGPVHLWMPAGYDPAEAGVVVYVHGYYTDVDKAFANHRLAEQFRDSGRNALFIVPEAPAGGHQQPFWPNLGDLIRAVRAGADLHRPWGPVIVVGHSGAYRTVLPWLEEVVLEHLILLDGLYGGSDELGAWLDGARGHRRPRMTLVGGDTFRWTEPFARERAEVVALDRIPDQAEDLARAEREARILYLRTQYGHMEMITNGKVIPVVLRLTALRAVSPP